VTPAELEAIAEQRRKDEERLTDRQDYWGSILCALVAPIAHKPQKGKEGFKPEDFRPQKTKGKARGRLSPEQQEIRDKITLMNMQILADRARKEREAKELAKVMTSAEKQQIAAAKQTLVQTIREMEGRVKATAAARTAADGKPFASPKYTDEEKRYLRDEKRRLNAEFEAFEARIHKQATERAIASAAAEMQQRRQGEWDKLTPEEQKHVRAEAALFQQKVGMMQAGVQAQARRGARGKPKQAPSAQKESTA
jgi:hypothetical protein